MGTMSETLDLTLLPGLVQGLDRDMRPLRLQVTHLTASSAAVSAQLGIIEQSFHDLTGEVSRGFGQVQQQLTRHEKRLDAVDPGLTALRDELSESTARIIQAIAGRPPA
jgi:hypothetical protein